jgi:hypothetical protein
MGIVFKIYAGNLPLVVDYLFVVPLSTISVIALNNVKNMRVKSKL